MSIQSMGCAIKVIIPLKEDERHFCLCFGIYSYLRYTWFCISGVLAE